MTHRSEIIALDGQGTLDTAARKALESGHSRFPVYDQNLDTILGITEVRALLSVYVFHPEKRRTPLLELQELLSEAWMVPETLSVEGIIRNAEDLSSQLVLVVDEYGQTAGLITMGDVFDEIAGEYLDEYDADETPVYIRADGSVVMDGLIPLERAGEVLRYDFSGEQYETLNGYLTALLGHIPTEADRQVTGRNHLFHILKTEHHTISRVRAEKLREGKGTIPCQDTQNSQT